MHNRSTRLFLAAAIAGSMWLAGCEDQAIERQPSQNPPTETLPDGSKPDVDPSRSPTTSPGSVEADNTKQNRLDGDAAKTPFDQGENAEDIRITADIRKAILAEENLSTDADNAKVITSGGIVTLRGVVKTQTEKDTLGRIAQSVAGVKQVDNQLEIDAD